MTQIDTKTGTLKFLGYRITPKDNSETLSEVFKGYAQLLTSYRNDYNTIRIDLPTHENLYVLYFFKGSIKSIEIYAREDGFGGDGNRRILHELGNAGIYSWGSIELYHNNQAGFTCVKIMYSHT